MDLSDAEIRVLGCLLEKQRTTPDHYPLSLNSLRLACNQTTNREPVVSYDEAIIRDALHRLGRRGYVRLAAASRAAKYRHLLSDALPMSHAEQAVMCVLMLRGPQTPGELKQRGERMHAFTSLDEVHATLAALIERGLIAQLQRRAGQKEERYAQLLGGEESPNGAPASQAAQAVHGAAVPVAHGVAAPAVHGAAAPAVHGAAVPVAHGVAAPAVHGATAQAVHGSVAPKVHGTATASEELLARVARLEREVAELRGVIQS